MVFETIEECESHLFSEAGRTRPLNGVEAWPADAKELIQAQETLGRARPTAWTPTGSALCIGGCFVCFSRDTAPSGPGERAWAAAALIRPGSGLRSVLVTGRPGAVYEPGLFALREGALLEAAVRALPEPPDVLLVNATGRDHPRRAGLALHLGAVLDIPTIGVTERPLVAEGEWPGIERGALSPLLLEGELVGYWLRMRRAIRPVVVHAGWRTSPAVGVAVVLRSARKARTPEPIRRARMVARRARGATTL
jgi:deoxyribonuclease V